jgi:homogentisate 1,2-dioxygenase
MDAPHTLIVKWGGELYRTQVAHSPIDVVAWHGNYYPYKYDLRRFSPVGAISFDHPDPSIFTVMTVAVGDGGHREHRFRDFPRALGGRREHVPPALVSPQHHVGVHGAGLRRVRRQA